jgi:hypothetical protein
MQSIYSANPASPKKAAFDGLPLFYDEYKKKIERYVAHRNFCLDETGERHTVLAWILLLSFPSKSSITLNFCPVTNVGHCTLHEATLNMQTFDITIDRSSKVMGVVSFTSPSVSHLIEEFLNETRCFADDRPWMIEAYVPYKSGYVHAKPDRNLFEMFPGALIPV